MQPGKPILVPLSHMDWQGPIQAKAPTWVSSVESKALTQLSAVGTAWNYIRFILFFHIKLLAYCISKL